MTTFWCSWCGATAEADGPEERRSCRRCAKEFWGLFRFPPRTDMVPLAPGEDPGEPAGAVKQFVFVDPGSGREVGRTEAIGAAPTRVKRARSARRRRAS